MRQDYKVTPRDRPELKRIAEKLRAATVVGGGKQRVQRCSLCQSASSKGDIEDGKANN